MAPLTVSAAEFHLRYSPILNVFAITDTQVKTVPDIVRLTLDRSASHDFLAGGKMGEGQPLQARVRIGQAEMRTSNCLIPSAYPIDRDPPRPRCDQGTGAGMFSWATFQPDTVITGVAPLRSAES